MFGKGKVIGPILIAVGVGVCFLTAVFVGVGMANEQVGAGGAVLGVILFGFFPLFILGGVGSYLLITGRKEDEEMALIRKKERILGLIQAQGSVSVSQIMLELKLTRQQVTDAIYELVGMGLFSGYIDWDKMVFMSKDAAAIGSNECPNCGGIRELVGKGVIRCPYCGVSLFIPPDTEQTQATPKPPVEPLPEQA